MKKLTEQVQYFNFLASEIDAVYHEAALKFGLSDSAMLVLYTACSFGGSCLLSDICMLSGTSKQTVHSGVRKLQKEGIVSLEAVDGRKKAVRLTGKGERLAERTAARVIGIENDIWASWTEEDRNKYLELTQRYLDSFKEGVAQLQAEKKIQT